VAGLSAVCDEELFSGVSPRALALPSPQGLDGPGPVAQPVPDVQRVQPGAGPVVLRERAGLQALVVLPEQTARVRAVLAVLEQGGSRDALVEPGPDALVEHASPGQAQDGFRWGAPAVPVACERVERAWRRPARDGFQLRADLARSRRDVSPLRSDGSVHCVPVREQPHGPQLRYAAESRLQREPVAARWVALLPSGEPRLPERGDLCSLRRTVTCWSRRRG